MNTITKHSGTKNVDAYRIAAPQQIDGRWVVITGYSRTMDDQGGYTHRMTFRDCSLAEIEETELAPMRLTLRCKGYDRAEIAAMTPAEIRIAGK